jgi:hypothetical protein
LKPGTEAVFVLYNLVGKEVFRMNAAASSTFGRNNLPAGLYVYTLSVENTVIKGKIILE